MKRKSSFPPGQAADLNKRNAVAFAAIFAVIVFSMFRPQPADAGAPGSVVPIADATPKKVKPVAVGDLNGDPDRIVRKGLEPTNSTEGRESLKKTRRSPSRTETVNNNETLRSSKTVNGGAQDGSGTDNANRHSKKINSPRAATYVTPSASMNEATITNRKKPKNQDIEVENDETHRASPTSIGTPTRTKPKRSGKHKKSSTSRRR